MPEEKMSKKKIQGKGMPNFCGPNESKSNLKSVLLILHFRFPRMASKAGTSDEGIS